MTYVGIDPGKNWGWAIVAGSHKSIGVGKMESLAKLEKEIQELLLATIDPVVATCRAMGPNAQVTRYHAAFAAIVELVCERMGIEYYDVADNTMRKHVVGKGTAKKPEVMAFLNIENEHAADAMVAALYLKKFITPHETNRLA